MPYQTASGFVPRSRSLKVLKEAAAHCEGCPLYKRATQTVFGEGLRTSKIVLIGEQPGHHEDLAGKPFVGPAGRLLARALEEAGVLRNQVYVTNAVKHFKWTAKGKRRLHAKPKSSEVLACRPWLIAEIKNVSPDCIVCLGATASRSVLDRPVKVMSERGRWIQTDQWRQPVLLTVHPSALLRIRNKTKREAALQHFVSDLRLVKLEIEQGGKLSKME